MTGSERDSRLRMVERWKRGIPHPGFLTQSAETIENKVVVFFCECKKVQKSVQLYEKKGLAKWQHVSA